MSRIHEALKKAEQERAMLQSTREASPSSVLNAPVDPVFTGIAAGASLAFSSVNESLLTRCRQTNWAPDMKTMLFFSSEEHAVGMEEFRTLRSRLYQLREKQRLSNRLVTNALPKNATPFPPANSAQ